MTRLRPAAGRRRSRLQRGAAWAAFAAANYAAMIAWPSWETIPFHFVWISLTLLYGFRVWTLRPTLIVLACVMALTGRLDRARRLPRHPAVGRAVRGAPDGGDVPGHGVARPPPGGRAAHRRGARRGAPLAARAPGALHPRRLARAAHAGDDRPRPPRAAALASPERARGGGGARRAGPDRRDHRASAGAGHRRSARLRPARPRSSSSRCSRTCSCAGRSWRRASGGWARWPRAGCWSTPSACGRRSTRCSRTRSSTRPRAPRSSCAPERCERGEVSIEVEDEGCGVPAGGAGADLRALRPRRLGAHALGRRGRSGTGHRRRDRQGPRGRLHGGQHRRRARSSPCACPASLRRSACAAPVRTGAPAP